MKEEFDQTFCEQMRVAMQLTEQRHWKALLSLYSHLLSNVQLQGRSRGLVLMNRATTNSVYRSKIYLHCFGRCLIRDINQAKTTLGLTWYVYSAAANVVARLSRFETCDFYLDAACRLAFGEVERTFCAARLLQFRKSRLEFVTKLERDFGEFGLRDFVELTEASQVGARWQFSVEPEQFIKSFSNF